MTEPFMTTSEMVAEMRGDMKAMQQDISYIKTQISKFPTWGQVGALIAAVAGTVLTLIQILP